MAPPAMRESRLGSVFRDLRYDEADRITSYTHWLIATGAAQSELDQSFGYDELGRLKSVSRGGSNWTINYDANGNRTGVTLNGVTSTYTTAATSNRLTGTTNPARSFGYDEAGNTEQDTVRAFTATYDLAGRLATLTKGGVTTRYAYDSFGRRVRKHGSTGAASTVIFMYGLDGQLLGEYDAAGVALREYVWLGGTPVAMFTPDPANAANPPLVYYIDADHLNTPRVIVDKNDKRRWRWLAEPFGTTAPETNPEGLGVFTQNLRFPGQYADVESGLFYNYFRDYDSSIGRYTTSDPIGLAGGINTFSYVSNSPLIYVDQRGLDAQCGPGKVAISDPNNPGGQVFICRPSPTEPSSTPICITPECAGGVQPTPAPASDNAQCQFHCNVKYQPVCTATGVGAGAATTPLGGAAATGSCIMIKYFVCKKICKDKCESNK